MVRYLLKRLLHMIPLLLGITLITFTVIHLAPGEPVDMELAMSPKSTPEMRNRLRELYGLDKPIHVQYVSWLGKMARLDFGVSFGQDRRPVLAKIQERIPVTVGINVLALMIEFAIAVPIGILAAIRRHSTVDRGLTLFVFIGFATPAFWLALVLMYVFGVKLGWLPISGLHSMGYEKMSFAARTADLARHLVLPLIVATFGSLAGLSRYMRSTMIEIMGQDFVVTARAKGLRERAVVLRHAFRNALLPIITLLGFSLPGLIGGSVIFETIFAIPGMGQLFYSGVLSRDYPVVMGILVIGAFLTLLGNLLADVAYALADPRIRHGRS